MSQSLATFLAHIFVLGLFATVVLVWPSKWDPFIWLADRREKRLAEKQQRRVDREKSDE